MQGKQQFCSLLSRIISCAAMAALAVTILFALAVVLTPSAQAQTFTVLHNFSGSGDGAQPQVGLTPDAAGNFYGTTLSTVFKFKYVGSGWVINTLYHFQGGSDGGEAYGRVAIASDGTLYGTSFAGGGTNCYDGQGCGTVFHLTPAPAAPRTALAPWNETIVYRFTGGSDGGQPESDLTFDQAGNIYGNTRWGGYMGQTCNPNGCGVVYELSPSVGGWTQTVLYTFHGADGSFPWSGVIFDQAGNLYGETGGGGQYNLGDVYELSPSGSGWMQQILYSFATLSDGANPTGGLIFDASGNLYGGTGEGGTGGPPAGTVFELTPSNGGWTFHSLYSFPGCAYPYNGCAGPAGMAMDAAGNLYGATYLDGAYGYGNVFKLTPSGGSWTYTSLHDFTGYADGAYPNSPVVFDAQGNLYGTASYGGAYDQGVVWEITP